MLNLRVFKILVMIWYPFAVGQIDYISISVAGVTLQQIVILSFYALSFFYVFSKNKISAIPFLFKAYILIILASVFLNFYSLKQAMMVFALIGGIFWALMIAENIDLKDLVGVLCKSSNYALILSCVYVVVNFSESSEYLVDGLTISSFYAQKNTYGRFLFIGLFLNIMNALFNPNSRKLWVTAFITCCYLVMLYFSKSKSSLALSVLLIFASPIIYTFQHKAFTKIILVIGFYLFMIAIALFVFFNSRIENVGTALDCLRILDVVCIPGTGRFTIWDSVINDTIISGKSMFGFGFGVYYEQFSYYYLSNIGLGYFIPYDSHNGYVDIFISIGWAGLIFWSFVLSYYFYKCMNVEKDVFLFSYVFIVVYIVSNISESYFLKTTNIYPILFLLSCFYISRSKRVLYLK